MQRPLTTSSLSPLLQSLLHQEVKSLRRILVRGVNWLGDAVMTTPALMRLRETCPKAEITLLTHAKLADLYRSHPAINHLITFQEEDGIGSVAQNLRSGNFELAVVLPNSPRSALEVLVARIRRRIGYAGSWRRVFLTAALPRRTGSVDMHKPSVADIQRLQRENRPGKPIPESAHQIYHYLNLMAALGCNPEPLAPVVMVPPEAINQFRNKFGLNSQEGKTVRWLGLNPGAEYGPAKRWPGERFV